MINTRLFSNILSILTNIKQGIVSINNLCNGSIPLFLFNVYLGREAIKCKHKS